MLSNSTMCNLSTVTPLAIVLRPELNSSQKYVRGYRRLFGSGLKILRAVDGYNHTETLETILDTGVPFHDLSKAGRRWGMMANWLSHFLALRHQVENSLPFQLALEDDLYLRPSFTRLIVSACEAYNAPWRPSRRRKRPRARGSSSARTVGTSVRTAMGMGDIVSGTWGGTGGVGGGTGANGGSSARELEPPTLVQLSHYSELTLTSLEGARHLVALMRDVGIVKSPDQQLLDPAAMGHQHTVARMHTLIQAQGVPKKDRPWILGRAANSAEGNIWKTRHFTWTEMAMLRMLTQGAEAVRKLPLHGNPRLPTNVPQTWAGRR